MVELTAEQFAQRAFHLNLVDERQLSEVWGQIGTRQVSAEEVQQIMLRRDLLTNYQAERLLRGDRYGFFYGEYKVLYLVGTGSFARVYRAAHRKTGEIVAVKVLRRRFCDSQEESDRFFREGKMGATLRHPHIVPIFDVGIDDGTPYLVMEFVEGRNLREFCRIRGKFEPAEATRIVSELASGLQYAALRSICHRDLKMSNVLVSSRGEAKLVDFGLAAAVGEGEDAEANPRTIDYAGLERNSGARKDDPRSDLFFLGCIYYQLLTGTGPLPETRDRSQRLSRQRYANIPGVLEIDPALPRPVVQVVQRAMEFDPNARYQTPADMLTDLKNALHRLNNEPDDAGDSARNRTTVQPTHSLMVVESNAAWQDIFRQKLKTSGFRVLVTRDPQRAVARFSDYPRPADCILFSTSELGEVALNAFNGLGDLPYTESLPAILLLGENQQDWAVRAKLAPIDWCCGCPSSCATCGPRSTSWCSSRISRSELSVV